VYVATASTCPRVRTYVRSPSQKGVWTETLPEPVYVLRIALPVFLLAVHGWLSGAWWRTLGPCSPDELQVPPGCLVGFSAGSPLGFLEDTR
jgi:hypothetical protein